MSFTKVTSAGIGSTELVTLDSLEVINNASIGGVLTYEDVTNVDSVGIITARAGVLVGSGITLSKDGDVFFTGIATGNGSGLTALNASNLGSGTVPTARLGSGTASSSTFLRGDSSFATVTSVGGDTGVDFNDNVKARFGTGNDLEIYANGSTSIIDSTNQNIDIQSSGAINIKPADAAGITAFNGGAVELYHNATKKFETTSSGTRTTGAVHVNDGAADSNRISVGNGGDLKIFHTNPGSYIQDSSSALAISSARIDLITPSGENMARFYQDAQAELYHNNEKKLYTKDNGVQVEDTSATSAYLTIATSAGSQGSIYGTSNTLGFLDSQNHYTLKAVKDGAVELYHDNTLQCSTAADGLAFPSGKGINFNATSDASGTGVTAGSELFDDYEEGTWTPTYIFGGADTATYTNRSGSYTKIGNFIFAKFAVDISSRGGSGSGRFDIGGLPFTIGDKLSSTGQEVGGMISYWNNMAQFNLINYWGQNGGTHLQLQYTDGDGRATMGQYVTRENCGDNTGLRGYVMYNS